MLLDVEKARSLGRSLNIEIEDLRRNLDGALKACTGPDRSLCNIVDSSGLRLTLAMEQVHGSLTMQLYGTQITTDLAISIDFEKIKFENLCTESLHCNNIKIIFQMQESIHTVCKIF